MNILSLYKVDMVQITLIVEIAYSNTLVPLSALRQSLVH
jgi:hypothetical protein